MPRYDMVCEPCGLIYEMSLPHEEAVRQECLVCDGLLEFILAPAALAGLPTPKFHGKVPMHKDKGFKEELKSIYKDDPLGVPGDDT